MELMRKCPECGKDMIYSSRDKRNRAEKANSFCVPCRRNGKNNPMHGRSVYSVWIEKYGKEEADRKWKERSENHSRKMSGENHPNYGKKLSEEVKQKIAEGHRGVKRSAESITKQLETRRKNNKPVSDETRRKLSERRGPKHWAFGTKASVETKAKMSVTRKGRKLSEEHRKKIGDAHRGKTIPIERRERIGRTVREKVMTPEMRAKLSAMAKARPKKPLSAEALLKKRLAESRRGMTGKFVRTPETRAKIRANSKKNCRFAELAKDPEFQKKRWAGIHARPNYPEGVMIGILNKLFPNEYKYTGNGEVTIDGLCPDFVNINGQKKIVEVFGAAYHDPNVAYVPVSPRSTEEGRKEAFRKFGYKTLVIWVNEINHGGREKLEQKLTEFHNS